MDIANLIPTFGNLLFTIAAFVVALSIIIAIHEYGHYIVGRWTGIKADVFSLGFGPVLASRVDKHGTKWQVAALPFGGYVKFRGDQGAASNPDAEFMSDLTPEERRATMHGAPLWARAATVFAGPLFNFILSFVIFFLFIMYYGVEREPLTVETVLETPHVASELLPGDVILALGGLPADDRTKLSEAVFALTPETSIDYLVQRDGRELTVSGPWPAPPAASGFSLDSAAEEAGMEVGDVVVEINGLPVFDFEELNQATRNSNGNTLRLSIWREGELLDFSITPRKQDTQDRNGDFETRYLIGMTGGSGSIFEFESYTPSPWEAGSFALSRLGTILEGSVKGLYSVVTRKISTCAVSGPITIAKTSGQVAERGLADFIFFVAFISAAVGFVNLFPVPVLDGGHLVFHAWEAISGRPPSDKVMNVMMMGGVFLVVCLMIFAFGNDIWCRFLL
ncbi:RIP metalloprotease RseP [Rhodobacteraceae bacterium]|nr:RIP metalloprotease RseP [Paracoccaceae bacterium]